MHQPRPRTRTLRRRPHCAVLLRLLKRRQFEIILQLEIRPWIPLPRQEIYDQSILDRKHRVICDMLVPPIKDLCNDRFTPRRVDDEVDMCRTHGMPVEELEEFPCGAVVGDGVGCRAQAVEAVFPVFARGEAASQVEVHLILVLLLIEPVRSGMPDVELGVLDRLAGEVVFDDAIHVGVVAVGDIVHDAVVHRAPRGVGAPEGAEDRGAGWERGRGVGKLVGDLVDERFEPDDVAEELAFVADRGGHAAGFIDLS